MKDYNIKKDALNDKGITLVALIITVIVMVIIAVISVNIGTDSLDNTRLKGFYMELETVQKRADDIATTNEKYKDTNGNIIDIKNHEEFKLTSNEASILQTILSTEGISLENIYPGLTINDFRYFTIQEAESALDLKQLTYNVFIHFDSRTVIAEEGLNVEDKTYYILKNNIYYPEHNTEKNHGEIYSLSYDITPYGTTGLYKIFVTPSNPVGDLQATGTLRYKKTTTKYWETSEDLSMLIDELTQYNVEYKDSNNNILSQIILISQGVSNIPTVTVVTD